MAEDIRISSIRTSVDVTDTDALLSPAVMAKIVAAVEARLDDKKAQEKARAVETRIGQMRREDKA